ncbi:TPA: ankyrin repeat domain-containing protein [Stenotrophomonas maltophilia]|nr:ankyrin repeat domain-containing protein [Stenotrophomonas maltophilia]
MEMDIQESLLRLLRPLDLQRAEALADALVREAGASKGLHDSQVLARAHALSVAPVEGRLGDLVWQVRQREHDDVPQVDLRWGLYRLGFDAPTRTSTRDLVRAYGRRLADRDEPMVYSTLAERVAGLSMAEHASLFQGMAMAVEEARARKSDANRLRENAPWQAWIVEASRAGHEAALLACIGMGADARLPDASGNTPLHHAARFGHVSLVTPLVEAGADVAALNAHGWAPLHLAALHKHARACLHLMAHGTNPEQPGWRGRTPTRMHRHEQTQAL